MKNRFRVLLRNPNFAMLPIVAIAIVATLLAIGLGSITLKQTDDVAIARQGEVLTRAIAARAERLGEQGIPQVFWQDAAEKVRARDLEWIDENYGPYLKDVFGYRQSYILDGTNTPIYAAVDGKQTSPNRYFALAPFVAYWIDGVRNDHDGVERTGFISEAKQFPDGKTLRLTVSAHPVGIEDKPSVVTVSTIIPDRDPAGLGKELPYLLVAVADIDDEMLSNIARDYGFSGLRWGNDQSGGRAVQTLYDEQGNRFADLSWLPERPAANLVERLHPALAFSFLVLFCASCAAIVVTRSLARARASVAELGHDANHDALTGLANRRLFADELSAGFNRYRRRGSPLALLSIDLDRFKELNDGSGHLAGDEALQSVSRRIRDVVGEGICVARVGGDEFQLILQGPSTDDLELIASKIIERVNHPMELTDGIEWRLGCSIGMAIADGGNADDLKRRADLAMSTAKSLGKNRFQYYEEGMDERLKDRIMIERALRSALRNKYLSVEYQPVLRSNSDRIVGAEALVRWRHPILDFVSPERFLPVAESTGLIGELDGFVLAHACEDALHWPDLIVSVNISTQQVLSGDIVGRVRDTLQSTGLPAERLEIEITERALIQDETRAAWTIRALRELGVKVTLDDVGVGYSSLSRLRHLAFTKLKIDRSLTRDIGLRIDANEIIFSLIRIGKALGMTIAAEGVETPSQKEFLEVAGCEEIQGFLLFKPVPADRFSEILLDGEEYWSHQTIAN